jgi:hypothetical protein
VTDLRRAGVVEEYRLGPATLEDVYVELVGRADVLANGNGHGEATTRKEAVHVDAA